MSGSWTAFRRYISFLVSERSVLPPTVVVKAAQNEAHFMMSPSKVGTSMVGRSDLLLAPQQVLSEDDDGDGWEAVLSFAEATSAPRTVSCFRQASSSALSE